MIHLDFFFHYHLAYFWFLTVLPCCLSPLKTSNPLVFSYFYHLLQPAVHLTLIHFTMPQVSDALRTDHTAEWTKDNITSRNSGRNRTSALRQGYHEGHSTINLLLVTKQNKTQNTHTTIAEKRNMTQLQLKGRKSIFSVVAVSSGIDGLFIFFYFLFFPLTLHGRIS